MKKADDRNVFCDAAWRRGRCAKKKTQASWVA